MLISFLPFQLGIGDLLYEILYFFYTTAHHAPSVFLFDKNFHIIMP